jgi:hypothetical protein
MWATRLDARNGVGDRIDIKRRRRHWLDRLGQTLRYRALEGGAGGEHAHENGNQARAAEVSIA